MIEKLVFALLAFMTLVPALLVVTLRNVFHVALCLVLSLTGVAGLFALLGADFLFVAQILLYVGGITVLLLFVVLLSGRPRDWVIRSVNKQWAGALVVSAMFMALLASLFRFLPETPAPAEMHPTTGPLGLLLLRDMVLPFEALSLVILAALVGVILFSKRDTP